MLVCRNLRQDESMTPVWSFSRAMRDLGAWVMEMLSEAVGTSVILVSATSIDAHRHASPFPGGVLHSFAAVPVLSAAVIMFFGYTLYLLTTAVAALTLRRLGT